MAKKRSRKLARVDRSVPEMTTEGRDQGPSFYTNSVEVKTSLWDVKMRLSEVLEVKDKKTIVVREVARVLMSPQHAKVLAVILVRSIQEYEKKFGKIPEPQA